MIVSMATHPVLEADVFASLQNTLSNWVPHGRKRGEIMLVDWMIQTNMDLNSLITE